jgi:cyanosortase A-associated protein
MQRFSWQTARLGLLAIAFVGVSITFSRTLFLTKGATARTEKLTQIDLPTTLPLTNWTAIGSKVIPNAGAKVTNSIQNRQYRYRKNGIPLEITIRHFGVSNGDVKAHLQYYTPYLKSKSQFENETRHQASVGFYSVFVEQQHAHLASCINGRGESTVSVPQFQNNRNTTDLLSERPLLWLVGLTPEWRDRQCLFVHMQLPLKNRAPEDAYKVLEQAWADWYRIWQPRLQKS